MRKQILEVEAASGPIGCNGPEHYRPFHFSPCVLYTVHLQRVRTITLQDPGTRLRVRPDRAWPPAAREASTSASDRDVMRVAIPVLYYMDQMVTQQKSQRR